MFKLNDIRELVKLVDQSSIQELEIENEGSRICIRKQGTADSIVLNPAVYPTAQGQAAPQELHTQQQVAAQTEQTSAPVENDAGQQANLHTIASPMVGTFYCAPAPNAPPFTNKGDKVTKNTVVCIVEAMKLMNEIEAEVNGEIVDILVEDGQLVEFGQPLFLVKVD